MNETKRRLVRAWVGLLGERSVGEIHIDDILTHAEVSRDTFYYYFDGIAQMPIEILERETDGILEKLDVSGSREAALHELLSFFKNRRMMLMRLYDSNYCTQTVRLADAVAMKLARIFLAGAGVKCAYKQFACEMLADGISGCIQRYMAGDREALLMREEFPAMLERYTDNIMA